MTRIRHVNLVTFALFTALLVLAFSAVAIGQEDQKAKESYNSGLQAATEGKVDDAITFYLAAITFDPSYIDPYLNLGAIRFERKEFDKALDLFKTASEKDPKNADAFANIGRVQYRLKRYAEAEAAFQTAISISADGGIYRELGKVYYSKKNYSDVISTLKKAHELGAGDQLSFYMLGKSLQKRDKKGEAIGALKKSIELKSKNYNAHFALGQIYLSQEKFTSAASSFKKALKASTKKGYLASYNYAVAVESNNPDDIDGNVVNWEAFIKMARNNPKAKRNVDIARQHVEDLKDRKEKLELQ